MSLLLIGCAKPGVSESEALRAINQKADNVKLSQEDTAETIQSVGELLYIIDEVGK